MSETPTTNDPLAHLSPDELVRGIRGALILQDARIKELEAALRDERQFHEKVAQIIERSSQDSPENASALIKHRAHLARLDAILNKGSDTNGEI